jgi:hypothetical protein
VSPDGRVMTAAAGRAIGPVGTAARATAGAGAIAYSVATQEMGAWDVAAGLVGLPLLATAIDLAVRRAGAPASTWERSLAVAALALAAATAVTFVTPVDAGAIFLFLGFSLLVVAVRGDAGCEVLAVSNAVAARRERTGCVAFAAIDSAERS